MKYSRNWCESVAGVFLGLLLLLSCGCEDDSNNDPSLDALAAGQLGLDAAAADSRFPDGLHPTSDASATIASTFAGQISPIAGTVSNVVVCVGDSITEGGYPRFLPALTGMEVIDEGQSGERSGRALDRLGGVLSTYNPDYVCILYGANNIIDDNPVSGIVSDLVAMVNAVRSAGAIPVVGTLTPMSGSYAWHQDDIDDLNAGIRSTVAASGARIADLASRF